MHTKLDEFLTLLNDMSRNHTQKHYPTLSAPQFIVDMGRKYAKVVLTDDSHRSVHCFVDKDGNVYKAASWAQPAKGVRYNLNNDMDVLRLKADPFGSYLYR
jgi:hypothetical protein